MVSKNIFTIIIFTKCGNAYRQSINFNTTKYCNNYEYLLNIFIFLAALEKAIGLSVDGADVSTICGTIDNFIEEEL